jgi:hypothetical protein
VDKPIIFKFSSLFFNLVLVKKDCKNDNCKKKIKNLIVDVLEKKLCLVCSRLSLKETNKNKTKKIIIWLLTFFMQYL